jgi:hypothetical protein
MEVEFIRLPFFILGAERLGFSGCTEPAIRYNLACRTPADKDFSLLSGLRREIWHFCWHLQLGSNSDYKNNKH